MKFKDEKSGLTILVTEWSSLSLKNNLSNVSFKVKDKIQMRTEREIERRRVNGERKGKTPV